MYVYMYRLIALDAPPKTLHMVVYGVDEKEANELDLRGALTAQLEGVWERLIKPAKLAEKEEVMDEGKSPFFAKALILKPVFLPSPVYSENKHKGVVSTLKSALDQKVSKEEEDLAAGGL